MTIRSTRPSLLIVDDQPLNVDYLAALLQGAYEVRGASSGESALALCADNPPDLILLDIEMPGGIDGYETCRRLKADPALAHIPVIFVTGHMDPAVEIRGFAEGAVDFLAKPLNVHIVLARVRAHIQLKKEADALRDHAYTDSLTGLANRRRFDQSLEAEWERCGREREPLALILLDVDFFKRYNDHYGHQAGDACLRSIGQRLRSQFTGARDVVARYGGEEFACILPGSELDKALALAHGALLAIREMAVPHARSELDAIVTASLGVVVAHPPEGVDSYSLLARADLQLYRAKAAGRGRAMTEDQA
jgi:diguanylate cyclase (GGDEF)-like protein